MRSHGSKVLREGKWCVGDGYNIPLTHPVSPNLDLNNLRFPTGTVGDLIDHNTKSWKVDMIRNIYPHQQAMKILQLPVSKTGSAQDQVLWKHAKNGVYQIKFAYELLLKEWEGTSHNAQDQGRVWNILWKVQVPLKINTFVWKLLKDSLPTMLALKIRGITTDSSCPICNAEEESSTHLFLLCPFARAIWHGSTLAIHTSDFSNSSIQ